ncbi:MAG: DUF1080 domain-containing protein [Acidobacteria bacterium]|nr:DUF1080 domain-containing protein [Acidobacteriota bacterium]
MIRLRILLPTALLCGFTAMQAQQKNHDLGYDNTPQIPGQTWRVHDDKRPHPPKVAPAAVVGQPPADAIVLFDGKDLSKWVGRTRTAVTEAQWKVENGVLEVVPGKGGIMTREKFGDIQLHVEWMEPADVTGTSQSRGNSGIELMTRYELQVLESYEGVTYADGQAGAIYGTWPPLVNACRKPGEWQSYDIVFEAPQFDGEKVLKPAYITVFHNGVLLHHRQAFIGRATHARVATYAPHAPEEPLSLQNHGSVVRYRNIWVRKLKGYDQQ